MNSIFENIMPKGAVPAFDIPDLNVSHLEGHTITIFSDQFPGKPILCRVRNVRDREIELDHDESDKSIENLVNNQTIVTLIPYDGQNVAIEAVLKKADGGQCTLMLDTHAVPLSKRRFRRYACAQDVKIATFPLLGSRAPQLTDLRWFSTETVNLSGGGALVLLHAYLNEGVIVLVHFGAPLVSYPRILLGQIRHCFKVEESRFLAGVEFITDDIGQSIVPVNRRSVLPASVFDFTSSVRERIDQELRRVMR